jgi:hypothetical protein
MVPDLNRELGRSIDSYLDCRREVTVFLSETETIVSSGEKKDE